MAGMSRQVASGELDGPAITFSGPMAEKPPLYWARLNGEVPGFTVPFETERDVAQLIESVAAGGGSHVKVFGKWDLGLLRSLLVDARQKGLAVILDPGPPFYQDVPVDTALALGIRRIEHAFAPWQVVLKEGLATTHDSLKALGMTPMNPAGAPFFDTLVSRGVESIDRARLDAVVRAWAETDTYFCPTLGVLERNRGSQAGTSFADVGHLVVAAGTWLGTLALIPIAALPTLRTRDIAADRGVADIVDRFSPLALGAAAILVATGVINALMHFDAVREVSQSPYGRTLIVKVALVAMVIAAGAFNWRRQRPRLGSVGSAALVRSSIAIELAFALAVLAVTGYLTGLPRPG
jgi:hypothetical protein